MANEDGVQEPWPATEAPAEGQAWRRLRRLTWELTQTLFLAALIFLAVRAMAQNFRVEGSSMEPGLHDGQYLLVNKAVYFKINLDTLGKYLPFIDGGDKPERFLFRGPKRGDVVVFRFPLDPGRDFIKRVIAVPGDTIEIVNGTVFVNGVQLDEPYVTNLARYDFTRQVVPEKSYFVLGDNRGNSFDSHAWRNNTGDQPFVPEENIIGQAMFSYWPLSNLGGVGNRSINLGFVSIPLP
jgi:signal peptidase I